MAVMSLSQVLEDSAPDLVCGQVTEREPFDPVEPRSRGESEAHVEAFVVVELPLDARTLVGRVNFADQIDLLVCGDGLVGNYSSKHTGR